MSRNVVMKVSLFKYILNSAIKQLIIQNKSLCLCNICVCTVYVYYVYINTHTYSIYFEYMYVFIDIISYHI